MLEKSLFRSVKAWIFIIGVFAIIFWAMSTTKLICITAIFCSFLISRGLSDVGKAAVIYEEGLKQQNEIEQNADS